MIVEFKNRSSDEKDILLDYDNYIIEYPKYFDLVSDIENPFTNEFYFLSCPADASGDAEDLDKLVRNLYYKDADPIFQKTPRGA